MEEKFISEEDRLKIELAKMKRQNAILNAQKAMAQSETADLAFKYAVLQVYMKYGLGPDDIIDDNTGQISNTLEVETVEEKVECNE